MTETPKKPKRKKKAEQVVAVMKEYANGAVFWGEKQPPIAPGTQPGIPGARYERRTPPRIVR